MDYKIRLIEEFKYPEKGAQITAERLERLVSPVSEAFADWWTTGAIPTLVIEGFNVQRLMDEHGMNPIAAFLTLDWLKREPEKALASLKKGHDRVSL